PTWVRGPLNAVVRAAPPPRSHPAPLVLERVHLEQVRAARAAGGQPGGDPDLVALLREALALGDLGACLDQPERVHRLLVQARMDAPEQLAAPNDVHVGR